MLKFHHPYCSKKKTIHIDDNSQQYKIHELLEIHTKTNSLCNNMKHMTYYYDNVHSPISFKIL